MGQGEEDYRSASTQTERRWEEVICTRVIGQKAGSPFLFEVLLSGAFLNPVWVELQPICEALEQDEAFMGRQTGRPHSRFPGAHNSSHGIPPLHGRCCSSRLPLPPAINHQRHTCGAYHGDVHNCMVTEHYQIASQKQGYQAHVKYTKFRQKLL